MYSARVYEKITKQKPLYKKKRVKIPVPKFIVLYNGNEPYPEYSVQKLSDSYLVEQENPQLELKVAIYNINSEVNAEIVRRSQSLNEHSQFIGKIKENLADGMALEDAIKEAIEYGIAHDIMKEFLETHGTEVSNMLLTGWNMDEALAVSKEEGYEDGFEAGIAQGERRGIAKGIEQGEKRGEQRGIEKGISRGKQEERKKLIRALDGVLPAEIIAEKFQLSKEYVLSVLQEPDTCT